VNPEDTALLLLQVARDVLRESTVLQPRLVPHVVLDISVDMQHQDVHLVTQDISIMFRFLQIVMHVKVVILASAQLQCAQSVLQAFTVFQIPHHVSCAALGCIPSELLQLPVSTVQLV
jgi:hypothetical protein